LPIGRPLFSNCHSLAAMVGLLYLLLAAVSASAAVPLPEFDRNAPMAISAQAANRWQQGSYDVWLLRGDCLIQQGKGYVRGREAVLWIDRPEGTESRPTKVIAYFEGDVQLVADRQTGQPRLSDSAWLGRLTSVAPVQVQIGNVVGKPDVLPPSYWRAMERRRPTNADSQWHSRVEPTQFTAPAGPAVPQGSAIPTSPSTPGVASNSNAVSPLGQTPRSNMFPRSAPGDFVNRAGGNSDLPPGTRRIRAFPRSDMPMQFSGWNMDSAGNQWIATIDSGVTIIIEGAGSFGTIDISTDRCVIWTSGLQKPDINGAAPHDERIPWEFYLEGNIVFRQGEREVRADRMYYDATNHVGTILNTDILTPTKNFEGKLRLHADVVRQTGQDRFFAENAFISSSRMGEPSYRLLSENIYFEDIQQPVIDPLTGLPATNPTTNQPVVDHQRLATASNDFLLMGSVPIFYWPTVTADLNEPTFYIRRVQVANDNVFGTQLRTHWSGYDLLGIRNRPTGTDLDFDLDYLSERGFGYGAAFSYSRQEFLGIDEKAAGLISFWGIQDHGTDNLGNTRRNDEPEKSYRERLFGQHRQSLPFDFQLSAEVGWISDRNFLEEYYKGEWETLKDESTDVELKRLQENRSLSLFAQAHINDFVTETQWLPRLDFDWLGQSLLNDSLTYYSHSSAAYATFDRTTLPQDTADPFNYMPWETTRMQGERFTTRQELDYPFQIGAVKIVPFVMGEAAHWGEDIDGQPLDRLWGQAGIRASLPMWSVDPSACSDFFNVHGLAHKVVWKAAFTASDANRDLTDLPLYDALDDDSVEEFRRRYFTTTFGIPSHTYLFPDGKPYSAYLKKFDERYYALRSGLQDWVTSPSSEVADDLMAVRFGAEQRWQTKRGPADNQRIVDWITLDTNMTFYPDANRDNFGTAFGLVDYDFTWHVGDRLTMLSDGLFDFFGDGQKLINVGGFLNRPPRGSLYAGFRVLEGPIQSRVLSVSYSYRMSPKWASTLGVTYDFSGSGNLGENFSITRIGESFLVSAGFNVDASRNSYGAALSVEPRFTKSRLGSVGGATIPPAGVHGLE
jgi:hypothetical protein